MDDDALTQALSLLRQSRSDATAELARIEDAIRALENLSKKASTRTAPQPLLPGLLPGRSVRTMMLNLLDEGDRDWSVAEILAEYQHRGTPVHGKDPDNALRAAIADAYKAGTIARTSIGRYSSARWPKPGEEAG
jgi:hypothetical protein